MTMVERVYERLAGGYCQSEREAIDTVIYRYGNAKDSKEDLMKRWEVSEQCEQWRHLNASSY